MSPVRWLDWRIVRARAKVSCFYLTPYETNMCLTQFLCCPPKVDMGSRLYFDASNLVCGNLGIFHPLRFDRIHLVLSPVVVPDKNASDDLDLEYQLQ